MIQGIFAAQISTADSAAALITSVNEGLIRRSLQSRFATCVYGTLAGDGRLTYCNAGHNPPLLIARDGIRRLETAASSWECSRRRSTLRKHSHSHQATYLRTCLEANRQCSPAELLERLLSAVCSFALEAPQYDDVTALVLRYKVTQQIHSG